MAFCAFETHKASNISEKHPSVIIDCCLFLSQKTSHLPKGNCFKVVQTKIGPWFPPTLPLQLVPKKKKLKVSGIWGHIPHFSPPLKNLTHRRKERRRRECKSTLASPRFLGSPYAPSSVAPNSCNTLLNSALAVARCSASWLVKVKTPQDR